MLMIRTLPMVTTKMMMMMMMTMMEIENDVAYGFFYDVTDASRPAGPRAQASAGDKAESEHEEERLS